MKTFISAIALFLGLTAAAQDSNIKTDTFTVKGNCGECKERIENAADIRGVKITKWDEDSKIATVTYDQSKTSLETIQKAIAAAGHDVGSFTASEKSYRKLPRCCRYRDQKCEEPKGN